jgi:hypothetical protein
MLRMRTGKIVGGAMATTIRRHGRLVVSCNSRPLPVRVETSDVENSGLWSDCGPFESFAVAVLRLVEIVP